MDMAHEPNPSASSIEAADELARAGRPAEAIAAYAALAGETPEPSLCLRIARCHEQLGDRREALRWALAATDSADDFTSWQAAAGIARRTVDAGPPPRRTARLAVLGSYTTSQLATMLWLAALRAGIALELYESPYGQYRQEIVDPASAMYEFAPDLVLLAVHAGELALPAYSTSTRRGRRDRGRAVAVAVAHARQPVAAQRSSSTLFALPPEAPFGHLGSTLPGSRAMTAQALNAELAALGPRSRGDRRLRAARRPRRQAALVRSPLLAPREAGRRARRAAAARAAHGRGHRCQARAREEVPRARPRQHALGRDRGRGRPERDPPGRRAGRGGIPGVPGVDPGAASAAA